MTGQQAGSESFPKLLLHNAAQRGAQPAMREKRRGIWRTQTWQDYAAEASALAAALSDHGLKKGDHVAFVYDNRPRLLIAIAAAQALGAVAVPLYQDASGEELAEPLRSTGATHVFAENQEQTDKILEVLPTCPSIRCIVYDNDRGMSQYKQAELVGYDTLLEQGRKASGEGSGFLKEAAEQVGSDDDAFVFFSSGLNKSANGAVFTHAALIERARVLAATEKLTDKDVTLAYLPPGWASQTLLSYVQPMATGFCVCCPEASDTLLSDLREIAPSYLLVTPRMLDAIVSQVDTRMEETGGLNLALYERGVKVAQRVSDLTHAGKSVPFGDRLAKTACEILVYGPLRDALGMSKLRLAYTAGDAIDPDMLMFFRSIGINLKQAYGATETGVFVTVQRNGDVKPDTLGTPLDGVELSFSPKNEILVRAPGLLKAYHGNAKETAKALDADGWFHTGDMGHVGDDGHLRIVDRMSDVGTLKDGTLFAPRPIENKIRFSPFVREVVVYGDGQDHVCALIDIDTLAVGRWADTHELPYMGHTDLASQEPVYGLIGDFVAEVNGEMAGDPALAKCQIERILLLPQELSADDGLLSRTGKLRRHAIAKRYRALIDAIFAGADNVPFDIGIEHVGAEGEVHTDGLKIRNVKTVNVSQMRKAA